jgi:hypothetical protein
MKGIDRDIKCPSSVLYMKDLAYQIMQQDIMNSGTVLERISLASLKFNLGF